MESNVFTFNQFMEATKHLDESTEEKTDAFVVPLAEKTFVLLSMEDSANQRYFYTKGDAKEDANKQIQNLRWFKKDGVVYARNSEGVIKFYIYQAITDEK